MGKKVYVNGGILINTRYFSFRSGCGVLYAEQPEGTVLLEPEDEIEGCKCLIIDDNHPRSIFDAYYAKTFITQVSEGARYYRNNYSDCFRETKEELEEVKDIISSISSIKLEVRESLMKLLYINIVTIVDAFICSIILTTIFQDENKFIKYYDDRIGNRDKLRLEKYINENRGQWEQEIVKIILHTAFENMRTIKDSFGSIGLKKPQDPGRTMANHFHIRNVLVHRNGRKMDGSKMIITLDNVNQLLRDASSFIEGIQSSLAVV